MFVCDDRLFCDRKIELPKTSASYFCQINVIKSIFLKESGNDCCDLLCEIKYRLCCSNKDTPNALFSERSFFLSLVVVLEGL